MKTPIPKDEIVVLEERRSGEPRDFLRVWHRKIGRRRGAGPLSKPFQCDSVTRRLGMNAVAMVLHHRAGDGLLRVGLRASLRPALTLDGVPADPEPPGPRLWELPAGIIEAVDVGEEGLKRRCSLEALEEMGAAVEPALFRSLGGPVWLSPGVMAERIYFFEAALPSTDFVTPEGDGSPMEEDTPIIWVTLQEALALCHAEQSDAKTELGILRFMAAEQGRSER